jgi:hypothetical protein
MSGATDICRRPVFIVGSPRSGTTILASSLARHSELWTSDESAHLFHLFGAGRTARILEQARRQPSPSWVRTENVSDDEFLAHLGIGVNALYTSRSGGRRWIEQTPLNTLMIDDLAAMFPGAVFIHMLRDGRRVVHSMLHFLDKFDLERRDEMSEYIGAWTTDFEAACRAWSEYVDRALDFAASQPERSLTVRNEDLVRDPEHGFRAIWEFLDVADEDLPAQRFGRQRVNSSFKQRAPSKPWRDWELDRRRTFVALAGATMERAGLEIEDDFLVGTPSADPATSRL